jgi:glycosyltransferase involved in cell wall biosynthesis
MKIAIVAPPWLPVPAPAYGGTEAVLDRLARGYLSAGHEVLLIGHPDSTCPVPRASVIPAEDTLRMGRASIELEHAIGAYAIVRDADVDVVHDHTLAGPIYSLRFPDLSVVATHHGPFTRTMNAIFGDVVPRVGVVAISRSHASTARVPIDAVVHHGVNVSEFPVGDGSGNYLAFLGRMAPEKGAHRAVSIARAAGVQLRIAAKMREPREIEYFEQFIEPHLGSDVIYLGEIDSLEKMDLLAGAVALINPISWAEPFGMAMLESLACGTPVVGCPQGAAPEIVDHGVTGFLTDSDSELAAFVAALDNIDRGTCRMVAKKRFSVEEMVQRYVDVFERRMHRA